MSILSSIGNFFSNAFNSVSSYLGNQTAAAINSLSSGGAGKANAIPSINPSTYSVVPKVNQTYVPNMSTPYGPAASTPNGIVVYGNGGYINQLGTINANSGSLGGTQTPITLSAGASPIYSSGSSLGGISYGPTSSTSSLMSFAPRTLSAGASPSGASFGAINSSSLSSAPSVSLPSAPSYSNPGRVNNGGIVSGLSQTHDYNPETNIFTEKGITNLDEAARSRADFENILNQYLPKKDNVYEDPQVQAQMAEVNARKQEVANYTSQLNSIVAQQNADLLRLREVGSKEGVTEAVYGGQAAEINREAAIKALPIQAQVSAAQGNLQLAQDYLTQLTTWKSQAIDNQYAYQQALYNSIADYVHGEEKIQLDNLNQANDRAYQESKDNIALQDSWAKYAAQNGRQALIPAITALNPSAPDFRQALGQLTSQIVPKTTSSTPITGSTATLTNDEIKTGAVKAGLSVGDFQQLDPEVQNYFANSPASKLNNVADAINNVANGSEKADDVKAEIDASNNTQVVKDFLKQQVDAVTPEESGGGFWDKLKSFF